MGVPDLAFVDTVDAEVGSESCIDWILQKRLRLSALRAIVDLCRTHNTKWNCEAFIVGYALPERISKNVPFLSPSHRKIARKYILIELPLLWNFKFVGLSCSYNSIVNDGERNTWRSHSQVVTMSYVRTHDDSARPLRCMVERCCES